MKRIFAPLAKLAAVAVVALSLGSCNRAEYALLPKSPAYLGTQASSHRAVAVAAPAAVVTPVAPAPAAQPEIVSAPSATAVVPIAAAFQVVPGKGTSAQAQAVAAAAAATTATAPASTVPTARPGLLQTAIAQKIMHKTDRLVAKMQRADRNSTASTAKSGISSNLKLGIILIVIGALVTLLPGGIFDLIGGIIAIIGLLLVLLAILDMV